jgi:hypothetical protein
MALKKFSSAEHKHGAGKTLRIDRVYPRFQESTYVRDTGQYPLNMDSDRTILFWITKRNISAWNTAKFTDDRRRHDIILEIPRNHLSLRYKLAKISVPLLLKTTENGIEVW